MKNGIGTALLAAGLAAAGLAVAGGHAEAIELGRTGPVLRVTGSLDYGDQYAFRRFVAAQPAGVVRVVDLHSGGGSIDAAVDIARQIRAAGWSTQVDAARSLCASACTLLFAAGVHRHYLNATGAQDGVRGHPAARGLAYHEASSPLSRQSLGYSGNGTAAMIAIYYEMGSPAAAGLITRAPPDRLLAVSGATALALGLATSLARP